MTLRLRLLLSVLTIVVIGLVLSDVVTYNALRSFLVARVDQQLQASAEPVGGALFNEAGLAPRFPSAPANASGSGSTGVPRLGDRLRPTDRLGHLYRNGGGNGPGRGGPGILVPSGTFAEVRNAQGKVEGHLFFGYSGREPSAPSIPSRLPGSGLPSKSDLSFTTSSSGSGAVGYRALAKPLTGGHGVVVIAVPLTDVDATLRQLLLIELVVSAVLLAALGAVAWVMVRRDLRPLEHMTDTAGAIAAGHLSSRVPEDSGGTEVAHLGRALNSMLDQIERALAERTASEERLRRFLADASHELRTPLTSIRGYSELFDLGVRDRPEDLATSLHRIRDEAARMGTLVDDLFLLAQLDHERPLHFERLDLTELVRRSVEGVTVAEPDRPVTVQSGDAVFVEGDGARLRQVVDNLLVNALRHTPAGSPVEVRLVREEREAVLTVHDHGPGVDPADAPHVFEPFFRSDPSRSRSSGGAGLGLAIVAAIVSAHGGTVRVEPGPGATFVVSLPAAAGSTPTSPPGDRGDGILPPPSTAGEQRESSEDHRTADAPPVPSLPGVTH